MTSPSHKKLQITRPSTRGSKSANPRGLIKRLTAGFVFASLAAGTSAARADDPNYYAPATQAPAAAPAPASPNAQPQYQSPYPTAERWVRRSQRLRSASAQDAVPKPNDPSLPPLPPLEIGSAPQQAGQPDASSFLPPSNSPLLPPESVAQRPASPAQMPGGTQFREGSVKSPDYGSPPQMEQVKRPGELPKVT